MDARTVCRVLESNGFVWVRSNGSHRIYRHPDGRTTEVAFHGHKDIHPKTLGKIKKATGLSFR